ncbi:hypothetical protein [Gemmatimonas phototrophica]|uniref:hypothetical protein n=1 Tax=Gemmatimonas phototrophica TaxID=1379270 RepID=UPI001314A94F|nr:hypothetical protein [Gemmatimonas phototrophica]
MEVLDVFFGLDDALPARASLLCRGVPVTGLDGIPVTFTRRIAADFPDPSAFRITTRSGAVFTPICATLNPALGASKRHTVLLVGQLGSAGDPPVRIDIVRSVPLLEGGDAIGLSSDRVTALERGPELRIGYRYARSELPGTSCPQSTQQIVQITWAGGVTAPGGDELGEAARLAMRVTLSNGVEVLPIALADLGDNDNYTHLCLDTQTAAESVSVASGVAVDPRGDLNPRTSIRITADPEIPRF